MLAPGAPACRSNDQWQDMPTSIDQLIPSLQALGLWSYWVIGLASLFEAFLATSIFVPGTLIVEAGGMLVQQGVLDYLDLAWFVAVGSILGGEASYWFGVLARKGLKRRWHPEQSKSYQRAERLFQRHGGFALIIGRLLGPLAGFVYFAAAVSGMPRKNFVIWNIASGIPFAFVQIAFGYFLGDIVTRLGPLATRVALFAGGVALVLAVLWWLVARIVRTLPFLVSIARSIIRAVAENPDARAWAGRHPRLSRLVASRLDSAHFGGLSATMLAIAATYILLIWAGSVADFLMADPIVVVDKQVANLVHAFWTPGLLRVFTHVTALGDWRVVGLILVAALTVLLARGRRRHRVALVFGLITALAGNVVTVALLKHIFDRPRPALAYFVETSGSFPSGHAAISVAFYGMLFYIAWRLRWLGPTKAGLLAVTTAFVIGLSRVYLIEHYLSDVVNGWLVGGLWLVIGIAVAEWWQEIHPVRVPVPAPTSTSTSTSTSEPAPVPVPALVATHLHSLATVAALALLVGAGWVVTSYDKARNFPVVTTHTETIAKPALIFAIGKAPNGTESIAGSPLEPINVIIVAKDFRALDAAMEKAGWIRARKPGLVSLSQAGWAALANKQDDDAPVTPYFWNGAPNDEAFQRATSDNSVRERHHVRFWKTRFRMPDGRSIFVGAASFDNGLDWNLLHHIAPNIDTERDILARDLQQTGIARGGERVQASPPRMGQSVAGDPWFTDGKAVVVTLR